MLISVIQHDDLQPIPRNRDLFAQKREDFPHRDHIFIAPIYRIVSAIAGSPPWEIDLAGLVVNQEARDGMMRKVEEEDLKGKRQCDMVS